MIGALHDDLDAAIDAVIGSMLGAVETLHTALLDERGALDSGSAEALDKAGRFKLSLLQRLESLDVERKHLGSAGAIDTALHPSWPAIVTCLAKCNALNQVNGGIVNQRLGHVRKALSLLTGAPQSTELYGPAGHARSAYRSASLAQA